jgi:hypothetical protein
MAPTGHLTRPAPPPPMAPPSSHLLDPVVWPGVLAMIMCFGVMYRWVGPCKAPSTQEMAALGTDRRPPSPWGHESRPLFANGAVRPAEASGMPACQQAHGASTRSSRCASQLTRAEAVPTHRAAAAARPRRCLAPCRSSLIVLPVRLAHEPYNLNEAQIGAANGGPAGLGSVARWLVCALRRRGRGLGWVRWGDWTHARSLVECMNRPAPLDPLSPPHSGRRPGRLPDLPRGGHARGLGLPPLVVPPQRPPARGRAHHPGAAALWLPHVRLEPAAQAAPRRRAHL